MPRAAVKNDPRIKSTASRPAAASQPRPVASQTPQSAPQSAPQPAPAPAAHAVPQGLDDPCAPEFYTSGCCGFSIGQGNVTLTFESLRCNHFDANGAMTRVVVGRVVMPLHAAQALVIELNASLQRSGFSPSRAATMGMVAQ